MHRRTVACALILAGALGAVPAGADVLHLKNGNRVRGIILSHDDTSVTVRLGPKMKMQFARTEVARVERESPEAHAALQAEWNGMPAPQRATRPAAHVGALVDDSAEAAEPAEDRARSRADALRERDQAIRDIDFTPEHNPPDEIAAEFGLPRSKTRGVTPTGEHYEEWTYDVGGGNVRVVRFVKSRWGYFADSQSLRRAAPLQATPGLPTSQPTAAN